MYQLNKELKLNNEKGVALIIMFFVMIVIVAAVLSVSALLFSEIKMIRSIASSVISFYAADSGIEKVLYYDRKVIPQEAVVKRGLCAMCATDIESRTCLGDGTDEDGLTCACESPVLKDEVNYPNGCDIDHCQYCTVSFSASFGNINDKKTYRIEATAGTTEIIFEADALGSYSGVSRAINILTGTETPF